MRSLATVLILLLSTSLFASYDDAVKLYEAKKYSESLKMLGDELVTADDLKADSPNYKIRYLAAHNHWKLNNSESVILHFRRCMEIKKNSVDPYIDLSLFLLEQKRYADATSWAEKGLSLGDNAMLYYILGRSNRERGNLPRAYCSRYCAKRFGDGLRCFASLLSSLFLLKIIADSRCFRHRRNIYPFLLDIQYLMIDTIAVWSRGCTT